MGVTSATPFPERTTAVSTDRLLRRGGSGSIRSFTRRFDPARDTSKAHCWEVARLARALCAELGLDRTTRASVELGALLHDVGKMVVPDSILIKPEALDASEWTIIRKHPAAGATLVCRQYNRPEVAAIVHSHHERWDGTGYPAGIKGEAIPIGARIVAVADAFTTMTESRPYRAACTPGTALQRCTRNPERSSIRGACSPCTMR